MKILKEEIFYPQTKDTIYFLNKNMAIQELRKANAIFCVGYYPNGGEKTKMDWEFDSNLDGNIEVFSNQIKPKNINLIN